MEFIRYIPTPKAITANIPRTMAMVRNCFWCQDILALRRLIPMEVVVTDNFSTVTRAGQLIGKDGARCGRQMSGRLAG